MSELIASNIRSVTYVPLEHRLSKYPTEGFRSGFGYIDVSFPTVSSVDINEITFKNFYTHSILLLSRKTQSSKVPAVDHEPGWKINVQQKILMPHPHCLDGSEGYFSLVRDFDQPFIKDVTHLRLHLCQPSPMWKEFRIEEIKIFGNPSCDFKPLHPVLPTWFKELGKENDTKIRDPAVGLSPINNLSAIMQELMTCFKAVDKLQKRIETKRYDIDGSYDINVLSHIGKVHHIV